MHNALKGATARPWQVKALGLVALYACILAFFRISWMAVTSDACRPAPSSLSSSASLLWKRDARSDNLLRMPQRELIKSAPSMSAADLSMTTRDWSGSPLVAEELRLIYCDIPKNACTLMKRWLMRVRGHRNWNSTSLFHQRDYVHDPDVDGLTSMRDLELSRANQMMHDPSWTRIVIVRDPVARFAAAFLDKCAYVIYAQNQTRVVNDNCPVQDVAGSESADRVLSKLEQQKRDGGIDAINGHFRPQVQFCDLRRYAHSYVVIEMDAIDLKMSDVIERLEIPLDTKSAALAALEEVSDLGHITVHRTPSQSLAQTWVDEAEACVQIEKPTNASACDHLIVPRLQRLYADDYELFRMAV